VWEEALMSEGPSIVIRLVDQEKFMIEVDFHPDYTLALIRAMMKEALATIEQLVFDKHEAQKMKFFASRQNPTIHRPQ
jgi:hypothetical protein